MYLCGGEKQRYRDQANKTEFKKNKTEFQV